MYDSVLPLDLVSCLREELPRGFLAEDISCAVGSGKLVRRIRLPKAELSIPSVCMRIEYCRGRPTDLLYAYREFDFWNALLKVTC